MISVLHFFKTSLPESVGGVENFLHTLCGSTSKLGVTNRILALSTAPANSPIKMKGYEVHQAKQDLFIASTGFSLQSFGMFRKLSSEADIIHYHFPNPFADILHFACGVDKPTVVTYHSDIIKQKFLLRLYSPLQNRFLTSVDRIVATSPNYIVSSDVLQNHAEKVSVIPIGIDGTSYPAVSSECLAKWRQRLPQPFFLFVGAMRYYKGLHIALEALKGTDIRLAIAGVSGIEEELKARAAALGVSNVDFVGFVSEEDKLALLELCHGFVFPSHLRSEAFGIALLEAAMAGKPLISCEIGTGTSYINLANETGLVVTPSSPSELREAMQFLLDNPVRATEMGANARRRAKKLFSAERQADSYVSLYEELIRKAR